MVPIHARVRRGEDRRMRILAARESHDLEQYVGIARDTVTEAKAGALHSLALRTDAGDGRFNTLFEHCFQQRATPRIEGHVANQGQSRAGGAVAPRGRKPSIPRFTPLRCRHSKIRPVTLAVVEPGYLVPPGGTGTL